jgi:DNA transformation protein and related proteins
MAKTSTPAPDQDFAHHCCDLLSAAIGPCHARRMFGGWGLSCDGVSVAVIAWGVLFLKVDPLTRDTFADAGGKPFTYDPENGRKPMQMSYWTVPEEALESPPLMAPWARLALQAALRQANAKPAKKAPTSVQANAPQVARAKPAALDKSRAASSTKKTAASGVSTAQAAIKKVASGAPSGRARRTRGPNA